MSTEELADAIICIEPKFGDRASVPCEFEEWGELCSLLTYWRWKKFHISAVQANMKEKFGFRISELLTEELKAYLCR